MERPTAGLMVHGAWYGDGERHGVAGPAVMSTTVSACTLDEWWHGKLFRADGPAVIERDPRTGEVTYEEWQGELRGRRLALVLPLRRD